MAADALERLLAEARADPAVLAVLQFGSSARGEPSRDLDLAVVLNSASEAQAEDKALAYAAHSSGRKHQGLDVSVFQALPLYVRRQALRDGRVLLVKDEADLYEVALRTAKAWEDFRPHYEEYLEAIRSAWA